MTHPAPLLLSKYKAEPYTFLGSNQAVYFQIPSHQRERERTREHISKTQQLCVRIILLDLSSEPSFLFFWCLNLCTDWWLIEPKQRKTSKNGSHSSYFIVSYFLALQGLSRRVPVYSVNLDSFFLLVSFRGRKLARVISQIKKLESPEVQCLPGSHNYRQWGCWEWGLRLGLPAWGLPAPKWGLLPKR